LIQIYDPRAAQDYRFRYFEGGLFSSWKSDCLVVSSEDPAVYRNPDLLRRLLLTFSADFICLNALVPKRQFIRRPKLEKLLKQRSSEKRSYFSTWEYADANVEHLVACFEEFSQAEQWTFGLYPQKSQDEVASLSFTGMIPYEDFLKNVSLFEYIVCFDLSDYWFQLVMRNESRFDGVIKFFEESGFSLDAN